MTPATTTKQNLSFGLSFVKIDLITITINAFPQCNLYDFALDEVHSLKSESKGVTR